MDIKIEEYLKPLATVREEHTAWYGALLRQALYPADVKIVGEILPPQSFNEWLKSQVATASPFRPGTLQRLSKIQEDLHLAGSQFITSATNPASFDRLRIVFEEFLNHLARLEQDCLMENSGLDPATGLRSKTVMMADLERELHRLTRQGRTFTIAIAKIDDFDKLFQSVEITQLQTYTRKLAALVQKSVRSFDDAYAAEPGEYVLCFKQSTISGGFRALERLKVLLNQNPIEVSTNGQSFPLTVSCCVGEPYVGDNLNDYLNELRRDLRDSVREPGTVLKYHELAPLKRFVKTTE